MELLMSPIGLIMMYISFPLAESTAVERVVYMNKEASQVYDDYYGDRCLCYGIRPQPRPP